MDAYKAIISKRDTRNYTEEPIAEDVLKRVLQAGRMAGSSKNREPFRFIVVRDKEHMAELAKCGDFAQPLGPATVAIVVCLDPDGLDFDGGRAAQNLMIAGWNEGLASCPVRIHHPECGAEVLGLPEGWRISMVVALGHPSTGQEIFRDRPRKAFEEYVSWEKFGQAAQ